MTQDNALDVIDGICIKINKKYYFKLYYKIFIKAAIENVWKVIVKQSVSVKQDALNRI